jgi:ABC-type polysaccharide/polyol phosphate export permease
MLLQRDLKVLRVHIKDMLINGSFFVFIQTMLYVYLFPLMGVSTERTIPLFLGLVIALLAVTGFHRTFRVILDLHENRFINYQLTLPLPKFFLFAEYLTMYCFEFCLQVIIPFVTIGFFVGPALNFAHAHVLSVLLVAGISVFFCSTLFLMVSMTFSYEAFVDHVWPRLLTPFLLLGPAYYPLDAVAKISPFLSKLFLLNPATYIVEGFRSALIGLPSTLSVAQCITTLALLSVTNIIILTMGIRRRLDPV